MSKIPQCENCGGTDYILESGFYFCAECNVQSQEIIEQVYDYYTGQSVVSSKKKFSSNATEDQPGQRPESGKQLTSWEVLNYILIGLVKELELLGANSNFKRTTLKLWAAYLMKMEVAFISQHVQKKPRLGLLFRRKDAELLYGASDEVSRAHRKPIYRPEKSKRVKGSGSFKSDTSRTSISSRSEKYKLTMKKKQLAKAEYMENSSMLSQSSLAMSIETLSERSHSQTSSQRSYRLRYTKHAKKSFVSLLGNAKDLEKLERKDIQTKLWIKESISIRHITMMQIVAILRLALILTEDDIHLGDIFRWNNQGYLSISTAEKLLPTDCTLDKDVKGVFANFPNSRKQVEINVSRLAKLLGFNETALCLKTTIQRYCTELALPDQIMKLIDKLIFKKKLECKITNYANYEGISMAIIVFTLKLLFGLDGTTERILTDFADRINNDSEDNVSFTWMYWVKFINARGAICSYYHASTREKLYPNSRVGGPDPFLSQWDNIPVRQIVKRFHVIDNTLRETLRSTMRGYMSNTVQPIPPSKTPLSSILSIVLGKKDICISPSVKKLLSTDFEEQSLDYLLSADLYDYFEECYNCKIHNYLGGQIITEAVKRPRSYLRKPKKKLKMKKVKLRLTNDKCLLKISPVKAVTKKSKDVISDSEDTDRTLDHSTVEKTNIYYFPGEYWLFDCYTIKKETVTQFEKLATENFPESFLWLLKLCAHIIGQPIRDLYVELMNVQKLYININ